MAQIAYTKNRPSSQRFTQTGTQMRKSDGTFVPGGNTSSSVLDTSSFLSGFRNPEWKTQIESGSNATTPLTASETVVADYEHDLNVFENSTFIINSTWDRQLVQIASVDSSLVSTCDNACRQKAYSQLSGSFKGLTVLGELRETIGMIKHPALGLRRGIDSYLRAAEKLRKNASRSSDRVRRLSDFRRAIADTWLEYSFGWKPLVGDIQDGLTAFNGRLSAPAYEPFKATYRMTKATPRSQISETGNFGQTVKVFRSVRTEAAISYQGTAKTTLAVKGGIPERFGLLPEQFVPTAWELAPWSFLIDYFTNVGSVLDCWATAQRLTFGYIVRSQRVTTESSVDLVVTCPGYTASQTPGRLRVISKQVSRSSPSNLPLPSFAMDVRFTTPRALNVAALVSGRFRDSRFRVRGS